MRETRPNATVTTLLDIVLAASPDRAKAQNEKEEIAQKYKPGDSVFPRDDSTDESGDDTRVLEEVRQLSLQESRSRPRETRHRTPHSRVRHSNRSDHDTRRDGGRSRRRRDDDRTARRHGHERGSRRTEEVAEQTRRIEHQSSLRSLLSLSDAETMEEEILRQILEEGLLDDIDMDNLGPRQEEELSERIAEAYRRRHRLRSSSPQRQEQETRESSHSTSSRPRSRSHSAQRSTTRPTRESSRPPASRPYLLEPLVSRPGPSTQQRRSSEGSSRRRRESPGTAHPASSSERPSTRSSSDMTTERPRAPQAATRTPESSTTRRRRATESDRTVPHLWTPGSRERGQHHVSGRQLTDSPTSTASPLSSQSAIPPVSTSVASNVNGQSNQGGRSRPSSRPSSSRSNAAHAPAPSFIEPSISCNQCGKANIQYELYKECSQCNGGDYHLCLRCYRVGRGCLQWPGFGASAQASFERILCMSNNETVPTQTPHVLQYFKYKRPSGTTRRATNEDRPMVSDDPARRLQTGLFCDICKSQANECFWKCNQCNEGDWGFCNQCVNQGRCCTHPLLPICRLPSSTPVDSSQPPTINSNTNGPETFKILSFSTNCDICTHPIPASTTRFHCLICNDGDYDVCANCYLKLGAAGKISKVNGHNGWRRCPKGHRMVVIGFEDHDEGQRRVVARDLVGGRALKDEHVYRPPPQPAISSSGSGTLPSPEGGTGDWSWREGSERRKKASRFRPLPHPSNPNSHTRTASTTDSASPTTPTQSNPGTPTAATPRFPPDGGVGVVAYALWSWYPEDGVEDELMFPRGAEITEGENINDDWYWGCYAGATGLFPGAHVRILGEVS